MSQSSQSNLQDSNSSANVSQEASNQPLSKQRAQRNFSVPQRFVASAAPSPRLLVIAARNSPGSLPSELLSQNDSKEDDALSKTFKMAVVSQTRPCVPDALAQLNAFGWKVVKVERKGDSFPLSVMAGHEIGCEYVLNPTRHARKEVKTVRDASVALVVGTTPIGGIDAEVFRVEEGLAKTDFAARKQMAPFMNVGR